MGWVEKRTDGYRAVIRPDVTRRRITKSFPTRSAAERWLRNAETDLERGDFRDPNSGSDTFAAFARTWLATRGTLKPSSLIAEESIIRIHLIPRFGLLRLDQITPMKVSAFVSDLSGVRAPGTVRNVYMVLSGVMKDAVREQLIKSSPCPGTRLPRKKRVKPKAELNELQVGRLIAATAEYWQPLVTVLAGTGMRWGEATGLRVGCVDILGGKLQVVKVMNEAKGIITFGDPKTDASVRPIPLSAAVVDALIPLVSGRNASELVFTSVEGGPVRHRNFDYRVWQKACKKAGLLDPRPTPHDLRHYFAACLIMHNVPGGLDTIKVLMGHESIKTTSDTYGYLMPRVTGGVLAALDSAAALGRPLAASLAVSVPVGG